MAHSHSPERIALSIPFVAMITAGVRDATKSSLLDSAVLDFKQTRFYQRRPIEQAIDQVSGTLNTLGPLIQWIESYVTDDKIYCVYIAPNEAMVREHAKQGGFPANRVSEVKTVIDPTTAEPAHAK